MIRRREEMDNWGKRKKGKSGYGKCSRFTAVSAKGRYSDMLFNSRLFEVNILSTYIMVTYLKIPKSLAWLACPL